MLHRERRQRRSIRLPGYDYSQPGAYFVTICTHERLCLFGEVVNGQMHLSPFGQVVYEEWYRSAQMRREIVLNPDEMVIMPNHLHGIVWIVETATVGADGCPPIDGCPPTIHPPHGGAHNHLGAHIHTPLRDCENPIVGADDYMGAPVRAPQRKGRTPTGGAGGCAPLDTRPPPRGGGRRAAPHPPA
ncbi:MAG: hypothetical protein NZ749_11915, partial [bacterium]|nr:hypothetical protein [bacterium]